MLRIPICVRLATVNFEDEMLGHPLFVNFFLGTRYILPCPSLIPSNRNKTIARYLAQSCKKPSFGRYEWAICNYTSTGVCLENKFCNAIGPVKKGCQRTR